MKITLTEHGRGFLRAYNEEELQKSLGISMEYTKKDKLSHTGLRFPAIPIHVKRPKIKISEEFKAKYDSMANTSRLGTETITPDLFNRALKIHFLQSSQIRRSINKESSDKLSLKMMKLQQKYLLDKSKSEKIINSVKKKLEQKLCAIDAKEEEERIKFNMEITKNVAPKTTQQQYRISTLQQIQEYKYGKTWRSTPRYTYLSIPRYKKMKYKNSHITIV